MNRILVFAPNVLFPVVFLRQMNGSAEDTCAPLIPIKSRKTYEKSYENFIKWCRKKQSKDITENVVLEYITGIYDKYRTSSLWTQYSILKTTLIAHKNVDISKFRKVIELLKGKTDNFVIPRKSLLLNKDHVETFISEAPDGLFLMIKVALIIGVSGACRREELCALTVDDIQETGSSLLLTIRNRTTQTVRKFTIQDKDRHQSYLAYIKKYAALRPAHTEHRRFFIYYKDGRCSTQVVGKNTFSKLPSIVATFLRLPDPKLYSGNCFKKYSSTLATTNITTIKQHGGWIVHAL